MAYRVIVSAMARLDAGDYAFYVETSSSSRERATKWLDGLFAAIERLEDDFVTHPLIPEAEWIGVSFRYFMYHSHRVIFLVLNDAQEVRVYRIYHRSRPPLRLDDL